MQKVSLIIISVILVLSIGMDQSYAQQSTSSNPGFNVVVNMFATGFLYIIGIITITILLFKFRKRVFDILHNILGKKFIK